MAGRAEVAAVIAKNSSFTVDEAKEILELVLNAIEEVVEERKILFKGFGSFRIRTTVPRVGRNPKTGEAVNIPSRRKLVFRSLK